MLLKTKAPRGAFVFCMSTLRLVTLYNYFFAVTYPLNEMG